MNIGELERKSVSIFEYFAGLPEVPIVDALSRAFFDVGIELTPKLSSTIVDFSRAVQHCLVYKKQRSKRKLENDFEFRLGTIKRVVDQIRRDDGYFRGIEANNCIKGFVFLAVLEKANLLFEHSTQKRFGSTHKLDQYLPVFRDILIDQGIEKPIETLASIFEKSGVLEKLNGNWTARTIYNKCSAAHPTEGRISAGELSFIDRAAIELKKELPECSGLVDLTITSFREMKLAEILERVPLDLRGSLPNLLPHTD